MADNQDNFKFTDSQDQGEKTLFPAWLGLRALASTAYKDSAYALSEVVDNSYGADAKIIHVAVICKLVGGKNIPDIIAVLDNGKGMDDITLRHAIQYGNGDQVNTPRAKRKGPGRFGVGLLSATFNQCCSLNIWSWQNGTDSSRNIELDVDAIQKDKSNLLPLTSKNPLPHFFNNAFSEFEGIHDNLPSGTLVVWRNFHKLTWKKPETLIDHLAFECGRIYRTFIDKGELKIVLSSWSSDCKERITPSRTVSVVDPMFLTAWDHPDLNMLDFPMFMPYNGGVEGDDRANEAGNIFRDVVDVDDEDGNHIGKYWIQASHRRIPDVVKKSTELGYSDPGKAPFGKIAQRLNGISVLREGRELVLDPRWLPADKTTSRWVSISIDFEAKLDDVFGVDNSKQGAHHLAALAGLSVEDMEESAENEDVKKCGQRIRSLINKMHTIVKDERKNARKKDTEKLRASVNVSDERLWQLGKFSAIRADEKYLAKSDNVDPSDDLSNLRSGYEGTLCDGENGLDVPAETVRPDVVIRKKLKVDFVREPGNGGEFFRVAERQGVIFVILNHDHPLFDLLKDLCRKEDEEESSEENLSTEERLYNAEENLDQAIWALQRLLYCYARAECEAQGQTKDEFQSVRIAWGRVAKKVMREDD